MMFAVCPEPATSASVVVAAEPDITVNFAYGVDDAPIATISVVVESETRPTLFVVQPPAVEEPPVEIAPQTTLPVPSVCSAEAPVQPSDVASMRVLPTRAVPTTLKFPVVVAPPEIVSPPICVPLPIVELAVERKPAEKIGRPEKVGLPEKVGDPVNVPESAPPPSVALLIAAVTNVAAFA